MDEAAQLRAAAIPLAGTEPDLPEGDLVPVLECLSGARLVGLGEATHGDHESFAFKQRLIRTLVREHGFTLVIVERGVAEMDAYDGYVTGRTDQLSIGEDLYPWVTEEMRDLLVWLREEHLSGVPVRFAGMDMQSPAGLSLALGLLDEASGPVPDAWRRLAEGQDRPDSWHREALKTWRDTPAPPLDPADERSRWICLLADTFRQWLEVRVLAMEPDSKPWVLRERFMAENALAQLERFGPDTKGMIWAHNSHVSSCDSSDEGYHLREVLGTAYRSVGFAFSTGRISAGSVGSDGKGDWRLKAHKANPPPEDSVEAVLERAGLDCYAVDPGSVAALGRELRMRNIGAYCDESWDHFSISCVPSECYDLLIYFREAHPSRVLPGPWVARAN